MLPACRYRRTDTVWLGILLRKAGGNAIFARQQLALIFGDESMLEMARMARMVRMVVWGSARLDLIWEHGERDDGAPSLAWMGPDLFAQSRVWEFEGGVAQSFSSLGKARQG